MQPSAQIIIRQDKKAFSFCQGKQEQKLAIGVANGGVRHEGVAQIKAFLWSK